MNKISKSSYLLVILSLLLPFSQLFFVETANACSCVEPRPAQESLVTAQAVFMGKVIEIAEREIKIGSGLDSFTTTEMEVRLAVSKIWKGSELVKKYTLPKNDIFPAPPDVIVDSITIWTAKDSATCGFNFEAGEDYLVYASLLQDEGGEAELRVSLCSRTHQLFCTDELCGNDEDFNYLNLLSSVVTYDSYNNLNDETILPNDSTVDDNNLDKIDDQGNLLINSVIAILLLLLLFGSYKLFNFIR